MKPPRIAIVGGGIIGSALALRLSKGSRISVVVLDKEPALGRHASGRNSGVIHSGINQKPGSLKARFSLEGSRRLREYCKERGVPMRECGTLVAASSESEYPVLERLLEMGRACGVPGLKIIERSEIAGKEPLSPAKAALFSPTGAVVDSPALLKAVAQEAADHGAEFRLSCRVKGVAPSGVSYEGGILKADYVVNCAGLYADEIARSAGCGRGLRIIPFRGEYREVSGLDVRGMIYRPPDLRFPFLSIHVTRETDGRVIVGPSAVLALGREAYEGQIPLSEAAGMVLSRQFLGLWSRPGFLRTVFENARTSLSEAAFAEQARRLVPSLKPGDLKPFRSGIRAQVVDSGGRMIDDLLIEHGERSTHVLNVVSPGMTASLAFADHLADQVLERMA